MWRSSASEWLLPPPRRVARPRRSRQARSRPRSSGLSPRRRGNAEICASSAPAGPRPPLEIFRRASGFDWDDAGIGAALGAGIVVLCGVELLVAARRLQTTKLMEQQTV
jgi:hypothetical protein